MIDRPPRPARGRAKLGSGFAQTLANLAFEFGGEGTAANTSRIRFGDADDGLNPRRADADTDRRPRSRGVRRGHEGVGAVV